ncbi:putative B3 domain-containing protein Os04g0347400 isoform X2 [Punica granatum]|uniref:Uncharacterized protein n=2 Tax=Punica granatum TaxID=22663 RepID=A0A2I0IDL8_PUNGR|nr:putative B3 domain-containing protein Os04g0347400 isoform X2 [Punica granatum]PKI42094.1 hypothetical protein CRG98_037547 [Punica granatum]
MASGGRRGGRKQPEMGHYTSDTPEFLIVLLPDTFAAKKIEIPQHFVLEHAEHLAELVTLKVPNGDLWTMLTENWEGRVWLGRGWENFIDYYSILPEYYVQFRLEGTSTFGVVILDQRASEIYYPIKTAVPNNGLPKREEPDDDVSFQIVGDFTPAPRRRFEAECSNGGNGRAREVPGAANLIGQCPWFQVEMTKSYVKNGSVAVPARFLVTNGIGKWEQLVKLRRLGSSWLVKMHFYPDARSGYLCGGWIKFARVNGLQVGDICKFELTKRNSIVFNVTIVNRDN